MIITTKGRAKLVLKAMPFTEEQLSYDEALELYKFYYDTMKHMSVCDVAYPNFSQECNAMLRYLTALNVLGDLGRTEHLIEVKLMVVGSRTGIVDELTVMVPDTSNGDVYGNRRFLTDAKCYALELLVREGLTKLAADESFADAVIL